MKHHFQIGAGYLFPRFWLSYQNRNIKCYYQPTVARLISFRQFGGEGELSWSDEASPERQGHPKANTANCDVRIDAPAIFCEYNQS